MPTFWTDCPRAWPAQLQFESTLALADVRALGHVSALGYILALHPSWHELGFDRLHAVFRRARYSAPVVQATRAMVFNRLGDADPMLGALRWLQPVALPAVDAAEINL